MLTLLFFIACSGDVAKDSQANENGSPNESTPTQGGDSGTTGGDSPPPDCTATVTGFTPADGATDVAINVTPIATFSEPVSDVTFEVTIDGVAVSGSATLDADGLSAAFTLDANLSYASTYTLSATVCDHSLSTSFTTIAEPVDLDVVGRTYLLPLDGTNVTWVQPAGVETLLLSQIITKDLMFMVEEQDESTIKLVGAAGIRDDAGVVHQYNCTEAIDFPVADFSAAPSFLAGPTEATIDVSGYVIPLHDLTLGGTFTEDGEAVADLHLQGQLDLYDLDQEVGICELITLFGLSCESCPDGNTTCLTAEITATEIEWVEDLILDPNVNPSDYPECR